MQVFRLLNGRSTAGAETAFEIPDIENLEGDVWAQLTGQGAAIVALQGRTDLKGEWMDLGRLVFTNEPGIPKRVERVRLAPFMRAGVISITGSAAYLDLVIP